MWRMLSVMNDPFKFDTNEKGDIVVKPVAAFFGKAVQVGVVLAVRYLDTPESQKNWDLTTVQFMLTQKQCLDLSDLLKRQAQRLDADIRSRPRS
jgi:hypothetical protein